MYEIIEGIIDHTWNTQYAGDQQYIYCICGVIIALLTGVIIDLVYRVISHFWR